MPFIVYKNENKNFVARGRQAVGYLQAEMSMRNSDEYKFTLKQLVDYIQGQEYTEGDFIFGDETSPLNDLGKNIIEMKLNDAKIAQAFKELAKKFNGKLLPKNKMLSAMLFALSGQFGKFDYSLLGDASIEVIKSGVKSGQKIGSAVVDSTESLAKNAKWLIPGMVLILGAFYVMQMRKV